MGPWVNLLSNDEILEGLRQMMALRAFDARLQMDLRLGECRPTASLNPTSGMSPFASCVGERSAVLAACRCLYTHK